MPSFDHANDADDAVLAHPLSDARARYPGPPEFRSVAPPEQWTHAPRVDPDELWDRLGDFA